MALATTGRMRGGGGGGGCEEEEQLVVVVEEEKMEEVGVMAFDVLRGTCMLRMTWAVEK